MARPIRKTLSAAGVSAPVPMDIHNPANISISVTLSAGASLTYTVEHTFDDVFANTFNPATATWFPNATVAGETANQDGNYAFPVTAIRLNVTAYTSGSATLTIIQTGLHS